MPLLARLTGTLLAVTATPALGWAYYTRATTFIPFSTSSPDFSSPLSQKHNPGRNKPVCIDHAIRTVPLARLQTTDQGELTKRFCQGIWGGVGFAYQRRFLEKKWRPMEGRGEQLWEKDELKRSDYEVGTKMSDHFEVVERTDEKVDD